MSCKEWREYNLLEVCKYSTDKLPIDKVTLENYISTENMLVEKAGVVISSSLPNTKSASKYDNKNILISNIRPYFKKIWYADKSGGASNDVLIIQTNEKVEPKYLYYFLSQNKFFEFMTATSKGTKMPRGDKKAIMDYKISLPLIHEQRSIANILSSLDDKIEVNNQMNKTLEEMAQVLFKRWFVDFEFPNEEGEPYQSSGGEMIESELGLIPKGWKVEALENIINISSGKRPTKKQQTSDSEFCIPLIGASSVMGYVIDGLYNEKILIIGRVGTHGVVQRFSTLVWPSDNTLVIKSDYYEFVYQVLNAIDYKALNRGSTQPLITQTDIKNTKIVCPNLELINRYETTVSVLFKQQEENGIENMKLIELRDTLLPKLMSGEIRVGELEK